MLNKSLKYEFDFVYVYKIRKLDSSVFSGTQETFTNYSNRIQQFMLFKLQKQNENRIKICGVKRELGSTRKKLLGGTWFVLFCVLDSTKSYKQRVLIYLITMRQLSIIPQYSDVNTV